MKALCWHGRKNVKVENVSDPEIINDRDAIIRITATAICGSDLHLYNGLVPTLSAGTILGHEFMGEVVETGKEANLGIGDKVVVPFTISCGHCYFCKKDLFSMCDHSNPNAAIAEEMMGHSPAGCFGFSDMMGGFHGGQAEYVRVPCANVGPLIVPNDIEDEKVLFLSDILPTGYMAAENANIQKGDTVVVWGCGPVGQFAIQSAWLLGAERVIAIDCLAERLTMAKNLGMAEVINFENDDVYDRLNVMTKGRGPDCCIDAVGTEAHAPTFDSLVDDAKVKLHIARDRAHVIREAIKCCRKGGTISIPGVYLDKLDNIPFGAAMNKGLTFKMGQTHVQHYNKMLLKKIMTGVLDPSKIITHRLKLSNAEEAYNTFNEKADDCIKVVMTP